jgi:hypothetical protein
MTRKEKIQMIALGALFLLYFWIDSPIIGG